MERAGLKIIEEVVEKSLSGAGFELVDLELSKESKQPTLRLFIDKEGGVTIEDCALASEVVGRSLDCMESIKGTYRLEVSSPGIERRLKKARDFMRFIGSRVVVKTVKPVGGRRNFTGILKKASDSSFIIDADGELFDISYDDLGKAHLIMNIEI